MALYYDLHIHSAASPCGADDMTPNNIVNMAIIKHLDIIAITDHNTSCNLPAIFKVAKNLGLMFLPGIEVQTKEEVHMLCYFKEVENAIRFGDIIYDSLPSIRNDPNLFGNQYIFDEHDNIIGDIEKLLLSSSCFSINELIECVRKFDGAIIPAHIDRTSYSIISNLGFIPENLDIKTVEISRFSNPAAQLLKTFDTSSLNIIKSSDAHYLADISERENSLPINEITMSAIFNYLRGGK